MANNLINTINTTFTTDARIKQACPICGGHSEAMDDYVHGYDVDCPICGAAVSGIPEQHPAYAGVCPFGYGSCFGGTLCDGPEWEGCSGCAYTRKPD